MVVVRLWFRDESWRDKEKRREQVTEGEKMHNGCRHIGRICHRSWQHCDDFKRRRNARRISKWKTIGGYLSNKQRLLLLPMNKPLVNTPETKSPSKDIQLIAPCSSPLIVLFHIFFFLFDRGFPLFSLANYLGC